MVLVMVVVIVVGYRRQLKHLLIRSVILVLLALVIIIIPVSKWAKDKSYAAASSNHNGMESMRVRLKGHSVRD